MEKKNSRKRKAIRKKLMNEGQNLCFYCGLSLQGFSLPKCSPGSAKARRFVAVTLEHLQSISNNGQTVANNCVLAHSWCNITAANLPVLKKFELQKKLSASDGMPPWWPVIQKIIAKETV